MRGDRLGAMLPRRERRAGGGTVESTQVDRAEGSMRERAEGPKRERSVPVLSSYRLSGQAPWHVAPCSMYPRGVNLDLT